MAVGGRGVLMLCGLWGLWALCAAPAEPSAMLGQELNCSLTLQLLGCRDPVAQISPVLGAGSVGDYCPHECTRSQPAPARNRLLTEENPKPDHGGGEEPGAPADGGSDKTGSGDHGGHEPQNGHECEEGEECTGGEEGDEREEGGEEEPGEVEESEEHERALEANTAWAIFVILILVTLAFESMQETLQEKAGVDLVEIVDELFGELTVLGFIGLLTSALINSHIATDMSNHIFGEGNEVPGEGHGEGEGEPHGPPAHDEGEGEGEGELVEILEDLHMKLFFMMVVFICEVVVLIEIGKTNNRLWAECQAASSDADKYKKHYDQYKQQPDDGRAHGANSRGGLLGVFARHRLSKDSRIMEFDRLKARFIQLASRHPGSKIDGSFDMAAYLQIHQRETFIGIVSISHFVWLVVIIFSPLLRLALSFGHDGRAIILTSTGWLLLMFGLVLRQHMGAVRASITPRLPPKVTVGSITGSGASDASIFSTEGLDASLMPAAEAGTSRRSSSRGSTVDVSTAKLVAHAPACLANEILTDPVDELLPPFRDDRDSRHDALFVPTFGRSCINQNLHKHGPTACRCAVSLLLLCAASLVAVLAHDGNSLLLDGRSAGVGITLIVLAVAPLVLLLTRVVPHACQDYVVASCVEELIEENTLSRTVTEQTAQHMVRAFKVLTSVRKQALLVKDMTAQGSEAGNDRHAHLRRKKISPALRRELDELFSHYDADGSGNVDYNEFLMILKQVTAGSTTFNDEELRSMFAALDTDNSGELDKSEFDTFFASHLAPVDVKEDVQMLFGMIEKFEDDGSRAPNTITGPELKAYLQGWWRGSVQDNATLPPLRIPPKYIQIDGTDQPGTIPKGTGAVGRLPLRGVIVEECHVSCHTDRDILLGPGRAVMLDDTPAPATPELTEKDITDLVKMVQATDADGDGIVQADELASLLSKLTER